MSPHKLEPADICVFINTGSSIWDKLQRWALGDPYTHVFLYLGEEAIEKRKVIFESIGRGALLRSPAAYFGDLIIVLRPILTPEKRRDVIQSTLDIACSEASFYDYVAAGRAGLSLILAKLHLPVPSKYQRDGLYTCSEAVAEAFWRQGISILPQDKEPLPGDFIYSALVTFVMDGVFGPDWL